MQKLPNGRNDRDKERKRTNPEVDFVRGIIVSLFALPGKQQSNTKQVLCVRKEARENDESIMH